MDLVPRVFKNTRVFAYAVKTAP